MTVLSIIALLCTKDFMLFVAVAAAHFTIAPLKCDGHGGSCPGRFDVLQPQGTKPLWYISTRKWWPRMRHGRMRATHTSIYSQQLGYTANRCVVC